MMEIANGQNFYFTQHPKKLKLHLMKMETEDDVEKALLNAATPNKRKKTNQDNFNQGGSSSTARNIATNPLSEAGSSPILSPNARVTKSVRFSSNFSVYETISRGEYSKAERNKCWFTREEYKLINQNSKRQIKMMESNDERFEKKPDKYCSRGLEHQTKNGRKVWRQNQIESVAAVIEEQQRQRKQGINDEDALVQLYVLKTYGSHLWARVVGLRDCDQVYTDSQAFEYDFILFMRQIRDDIKKGTDLKQ